MKILTFSSPEFPGSMEWAAEHAIDGAFVLDPSVSEQSAAIAAKCKERDKPMVLGFRYDALSPAPLARATTLTDPLALATSHLNEWSPLESIATWHGRAERLGAHWWCSYIHVRMLEDLHTFKVRDQLVEYNVPVVILCGYMLARYALGESVPTFNTSLMGADLVKDFRLTPDALQKWLEPLEAYSGCAGQQGIDRGTIRSCEEVGFGGVVCAGPFHEEDWEDKHPPPRTAPGVYKDLVDTTWK